MSNIIAIVGRPNVGKSTLFNRIVKQREAIVDSVSGVTRDRNYGKGDWNGKEFSLIDTGGYVVGSDDIFELEIDKQVELAIDEADIIIFMVDVESGITSMDMDIANMLRKNNKPVYLVVNKVDSSARINDATEFYELGIDKYYPIASINGFGTGDLLDDVVKDFSEDIDLSDDLPKFAVIGRPNAGKSSFINALIGENRNIVTDIPGTTRDSIHTKYKRFGFEFNLVDTAGIRRKSKVKENLEFYSVMRSVRAIEYSDVCLLIYDVSRGFDSQVKNIFWLCERNKKGIVIIANKWDLIEKDNKSTKNYEIQIKKEIEPFVDVPIIFVSIINKQRIYKAIESAVDVYTNRSKKIKTRELNDILLPIIAKYPPPAIKGKYVKIKYITQLPTSHPQFAFFCNLPQYIKDPYKRFLENKIRENFDLCGAQIDIYMRKK
ncbi:MAG: ribosome biogenesis GTPase Der [Flavobacteriaceae bacterium]|jgi:GTPase|nr:ribosome biogenesis GTPase Der [Flavobacteriaceae bacterium]MBT4113529.1 ribosome biogenesis GTPase Der [Flavobacteriaceae bacterium]MBT4613713.1 ribosome biogenesis GTPase Der [Flavobacteriaceae bacterium]MBT5246047.1 ribosome biogenesis GTPase Der [Flavobacteriaceae bacterium]MBT5650686.1 ribosome biogenesis GTPase Der [Flavobacteriaceae bacterium]